jgi:long-chain acyl-CoA synthetase
LPLYHIFAFTISMMLSLRLGGKTILIPNPRDIPAVLKALAHHRIHTFPAVSSLFSALVNHPDFGRVDWSHLTSSVGGGTAVLRGVAQQWLEKTGCAICEGYGLSETSPSVCCNPADVTAHDGSIGPPLPNTWVKLLNDDGLEVALGQPGEIAVKGPQVMAGYWQRPDETAKVMTADGYLKTGDIGMMDARGFFTIVDRKKDMVISGGENIYCAEVERAMGEIAGITECAAFGIADERLGELLVAVVVANGLTEAAICGEVGEKLARYKAPGRVAFSPDPLPRNAVGKVDKIKLKALWPTLIGD